LAEVRARPLLSSRKTIRAFLVEMKKLEVSSV